MVVRFGIGPSDLGLVLVATTARGVAAILFGDDIEAMRLDLVRRFPEPPGPFDPTNITPIVAQSPTTDLAPIVAQVAARIADPFAPFDHPLDLGGTPFQRQVWEALRAIPPGTTTSYGALAAAIGRPTVSRAVARACATNAHAVVVPCHRVVRGDGGLSGYRWGVDRKAQLLQIERGAAPAEPGMGLIGDGAHAISEAGVP